MVNAFLNGVEAALGQGISTGKTVDGAGQTT